MNTFVLTIVLSSISQIGTSRQALLSAEVEAAGSLDATLGNDGALTQVVPIELPAARGGKVGPALSLAYQSNGRTTFLGRGWSMPLVYIEEDSFQRTPDAPDAIDVSGLFRDVRYRFFDKGAQKRLIAVGNDRYRAEIEQSHLVFTFTNGEWSAVDGYGTRYHFRVRQLQPATTVPLRWYLTHAVDTNGNWTHYQYRDTSGPSCVTNTDRAVSLAWVSFNNLDPLDLNATACPAVRFKERVELVYEPRTDPVYLAELHGVSTINDRLREIRVSSSDGLGALQRIRTYHLSYTQAAPTASSLLERIAVTGYRCSLPSDCPPDAHLPMTLYAYETGPLSFEAGATSVQSLANDLPDHMGLLTSDGEATGGVGEDRVGMIDFDGDGRADLVSVDYLGLVNLPNDWSAWLNRGGDPWRDRASPFESQLALGTTLNNLRRDGSNLVDMDGDGRPDLIDTSWGVYFNQGGSFASSPIEWDTSGVTAYLGVSRIDTRNSGSDGNPNPSHWLTQSAMYDLTGDGIQDYVVATHTQRLWYVFAGYLVPTPNGAPIAGGFAHTPIPWRFTSSMFRNHQTGYFPIERVRSEPITSTPEDYVLSRTLDGLVDIDGDGLLDYVTVQLTVGAWVFLNDGRGFTEVPFGSLAAISERNIYPDRIIQTRGLIDVNGDGPADIVIQNGQRLLAAYGSGHDFVLPNNVLLDTGVGGPRPYVGSWDGPSSLLMFQRQGLADLNGDGLVDYVVSTDTGAWQVHFNATDRGLRPHLLSRVENGIGGGMEFGFAPSVAFDSHLPSISLLVVRQQPLLSLAPEGIAIETTYERGFLVRNESNSKFDYRGFERVITGRKGGLSVMRQYPTTDADLHFKVAVEEERDQNGCTFLRRTIDWRTHAPSDVATQGSVRIPYARSTDAEHFLDGVSCGTNPVLTSRHEVLSLDDHGNVTLDADRGDVSRSDDDVFRSIDYAEPLSSEVVALPWRQRTCIDEQCTQVLGTARYWYDGVQDDDADSLAEGEVEGGNLKQKIVDVYDLATLSAAPTEMVTERYAYDSRGNVTRRVAMIDGDEGNVTSIEYDPRFELLPISRTTGRNIAGGMLPERPLTTSTVFLVDRELPDRETDPNGNTSWRIYDGIGRIAQQDVTRNGQRERLSTASVVYLPDGMEIVETADRGSGFDTQHRRFDGLGRLVRAWRPMGGAAPGVDVVQQSITYDVHGRVQVSLEPHESTNAAPMAQYHFYDSLERSSTMVRQPFLGVGVLPNVLDPTDVSRNVYVTRTRYGMTSEGFFTTVFDPVQNQFAVSSPGEVRVLDLRGGLVRATDASGETVGYSYDRLGNRTTVTRTLRGTTNVPIVVTSTYDSLGRMLSTIDPDKGRLTFRYDYAGRLLRQEAGPSISPETAVLIAYDIHGRQVKRSAETRVRGIWLLDPSLGVIYGYDDGTVPDATHPAPSHLAGRMSWMLDGAGRTFFGYDEAGNPTYLGREFTGLAGVRSIERSFDLQGRLQSVTYDGGEAIEYEYDSAARLTRVTAFEMANNQMQQRSYWEAQSFHELGVPSAILRADANLSEEQDYDPLNQRFTQLRTWSAATPGAPIFHESYTQWDADGHLLAARNPLSQTDYEYRYDDAYRLRYARALLSAGGTVPGQSFFLQYTYDSLGNLREQHDTFGGSLTRTFQFRTNGVAPHSPATWFQGGVLKQLGYGRGNLLTEKTCVQSNCTPIRTFGYTPEDRLEETIDYGASATVFNGYDGLGGRAFQQLVDNNGVVRTVHYLGGLLEVETEPGNPLATIRWNVLGGGKLLVTKSHVEGQQTYVELHHVADGHGSLRLTTDRHGAVQSRTDYLPFGEIDVSASADVPQFGFAGREHDLGGGLIAYGARHYDPVLMRFLSADTHVPDASNIGWNRYAYAFNDPINFADPTGHEPVTIAAVLIGAAVGAATGAIVGGISGALAASFAGKDAVRGFLIGAAFGAVSGAIGGALGVPIDLPQIAQVFTSPAASIANDLAAERSVDWGHAVRAIAPGLVRTGFDFLSDDFLRTGTFGFGKYTPDFANVTTQTFLYGAVSGFAASLVGGDNVGWGTLLGIGRQLARAVVVYVADDIKKVLASQPRPQALAPLQSGPRSWSVTPARTPTPAVPNGVPKLISPPTLLDQEVEEVLRKATLPVEVDVDSSGSSIKA